MVPYLIKHVIRNVYIHMYATHPTLDGGMDYHYLIINQDIHVSMKFFIIIKITE